MEKDRVSVNLDNIDKSLKQLLDKCEVVEKSIINTRDKLDESKKYFDTPAAEYFRKQVDDLLDEEVLKFKNDFVPSIEVLNQVLSLYKEEFSSEQNMIKSLKGS